MSKNAGFTVLIRKRIIIIMSLITLLIFFLNMIIFFMGEKGKKELALIDLTGRQRMLTQRIAKDVNRRYALLQEVELGTFDGSMESLDTRLEQINQSLQTSKKEFETTLNALKKSKIKTGDSVIKIKKSHMNKLEDLLEKTESQWLQYEKAVNAVINSDKVRSKATKALMLINSQSDQLLSYSEEINQSLIKFERDNEGTNMKISFGLFLLSLVLLVLSLMQLEKYIIEPLDALFKGVSVIGEPRADIRLANSSKRDLAPVINEINAGFVKLKKLNELIQNVNQNVSFDGILKFIYGKFAEFIPYQHIGIALLKDDGRNIEASFGYSHESIKDLPKKLVGLKVSISDTSLGKILMSGVPRVINDLEEYSKEKGRNQEYNKILLDEGVRASITFPLKINNEPVGIIFFSSIHKNIYQQQHISILETLSSSIAISLNKNIFIDELLLSTILALAKLAESRDEDTGDHLERMMQYSVLITELLMKDNVYDGQLSISFVRDIERFAPMHDIGKVAIRDEILLKPGKLTFEEFEEMKEHANYGAEVMRVAEENINKLNRSIFKLGIEIAEAHHEKWDGSGYPYGKSGEEIPLSARIVAVADVLDALTSKRPYKRAFSFEESMKIILEGRGGHFDPNIIDTVMRHKLEVFKLYASFQHKKSRG